MARRIKTVSGGYKEVRKDGEQPEFFSAQHIILFGSRNDLGDKVIGVFNVEDEIPDENEELKSRADSYADDMKAPFYELSFKKSVFPIKSFFKGISNKKMTVILNGEIQLYVHNKPARLK